jgi:fructokinase
MVSSLAFPCVAIGELLWDLLPSGARLGGTTTNFAVLSARLGEHATLVSCVGDDALGKEAIGRLSALVSESATPTHLSLQVQVDDLLPTGTVAVRLDGSGRPRYKIVSPVAWDAIRLSPELMELARRASVICFGTLAQRCERSRESIRAVIQAAGPACVRVCDFNVRAPFASYEVVGWSVRHADVLKVSDEELPEVARLLGEPSLATEFPLTGSAGLTEMASKAAKALLALAPQCRLVAITLGPHGSLLADRVSSYRHEGFPVEVVDTIGAGDAFSAGLVHAYVRGASLEQMSEVANRCGSYVASQQGATPELPESLLACIASVLQQPA